MKYYLILATIFICYGCSPKNKLPRDKLKLLILSGSNNHEWQQTTRQLQHIYLESGRFETDITTSPDTLIYEHFNEYDAVVSNWNAWPQNETRWPKETENGLLQYIRKGGGFVLFHAASAAFYEWEAYQHLVGSTWGDSTTHGKILPFLVELSDEAHPITKGMADFWITDELWVHSQTRPDINILAAAYSHPDNKGRGEMEPVVSWNTSGEGRCFHNVLGHNVRAMKNTGWETLMLRGTEWAATGEVSIPIPASISGAAKESSLNYSWDQTDTTVALLQNDEIVWQYNFNTIKGKPFFHPVTIGNTSITWLSPEDHPWHLGIWHSWKFINGVNYWEYDRSEGVQPFNFLGITEVKDISFKKGQDYSCRIELNIAYHENDGADLLTEHRIVTVTAPDAKGQFSIDYVFDLEAAADSVELNRTPLPHEENGKNYGGYAGLSVRFSQDMFDPSFINPGGSTEMAHGKPSAWKFYGLRNISGDQVGVSIFTDTQNLNHPEPWFMTSTEDHPFYYFSPAPIFNKPHLMNKEDTLKLRYRIKFYAGKVSTDILDQDYITYLDLNNKF